MTLDRDAILLGNLQLALAAYERGVFSSMTASAAFFLLSLRLKDPRPIQILWGELTVPIAWFLALLLFFVLGGYTLSVIKTAEILLKMLAPTEKVQEAIRYSTSLAAIHNPLYRVGTVLFCPTVVLVSFGRQLKSDLTTHRMTGESWMGLVGFCLLVLVVYGRIVAHVWRPFGSTSSKDLPSVQPL